MAAGTLLVGLAFSVWHSTSSHNAAPAATKTATQEAVKVELTPAPDVLGNSTTSKPTPAAEPKAALTFSHLRITTTVFWAGEGATADNDHISNAASAWQEQWQQNFGGYDNPTKRNAFAPAGFTPKENPFYFALPYNDISSSGSRKNSAKSCPNSSSKQPHSWCKNAWIAIRHGNKVAYAQWEDVGPNEEDDYNYVFGNTPPRNTFGEKAGLDVSPGVRDYLALGDVSQTDWAFVPADEVPDGPWKTIITTSLGTKL